MVGFDFTGALNTKAPVKQIFFTTPSKFTHAASNRQGTNRCIGVPSGSKIIRYLLAEKGVEVSLEQATVLREYIRVFAVKNKMAFTPETLESFFKSLLEQDKGLFGELVCGH